MKSGDNMMSGMLHVVLDTDISTGDRLYCEVDHNTCGEQDEPTIALSWCRKGSSPDESNIGYWFVPVSVMRKLCDLVESSHALGDLNWKRSEEATDG